MCEVIVRIKLEGVPAKDIEEDPVWFEKGRISIDEAYLKRNEDDDSFFLFEFEGVEDE